MSNFEPTQTQYVFPCPYKKKQYGGRINLFPTPQPPKTRFSGFFLRFGVLFTFSRFMCFVSATSNSPRKSDTLLFQSTNSEVVIPFCRGCLCSLRHYLHMYTYPQSTKIGKMSQTSGPDTNLCLGQLLTCEPLKSGLDNNIAARTHTHTRCHPYIYIYRVSCGVIIWSKFGLLRGYYLVQVCLCFNIVCKNTIK